MTLKSSGSLFVYMLSFVVLMSCQTGTDSGSPYSPQESMKNIQIPEGFRLELVASEPLIRDPVEIAFDTHGDLYVVEMPEYPSRGKNSPSSTVVKLTDTDGDGVYDKRTVFAEDLPFVNGVMPWKNGVLVTNAPDILYFEDTTGDGRADIRKVVLTGFATTNPQLRVSNLRYGIDNWIYGTYFNAFGSGGDAQFEGKGEPLSFPQSPEKKKFDIKPGMDFRFRPDDYVVERSGGVSQFGNTFDAYGNRFTLMNADHIRHVVIPHRYAERNAHYSLSNEMESISDHEKATRLFSITKNMQDFRSSEHEVGHVTSACGNSIYNGGIFPEEYNRIAFMCDPARNVVHADRLSVNGATFTASRIFENREFMGSTESWFRPVNTTIGPDGALYVVDMYRKLVEHPAFIPHSGILTKEGGYQTQVGIILESDFYEGQDRGRIYRIVPDNYQPDNKKPAIDDRSPEQWIAQLDHPNYWWRINAQRLLVTSGSISLKAELGNSLNKPLSPEGYIHTLWTMEGLRVLDDAIVEKALKHENGEVRKQSIILSETRLNNPDILNYLAKLSQDPEPYVQFQALLTLGMLPHQKSFEPVFGIVKNHLTEKWFQDAACLSITDHSVFWYKKVLDISSENDAKEKGKEELLKKIAGITGSLQNKADITDLLALIVNQQSSSVQTASLSGLQRGLQQGGKIQKLPVSGQEYLLELASMQDIAVQKAALDLAKLLKFDRSASLGAAIAQSKIMVTKGDEPDDHLISAVKILGLNPDGIDQDLADNLLSPKRSIAFQQVAMETLLDQGDVSILDKTIDHWNNFPKAVRDVAEQKFLGNEQRTLRLLKAVKDEKIKASLIGRKAQSVLKQHPDKDIRELANQVLTNFSLDQRKEVETKYYEATGKKGNLQNGKLVFERVCSQCHRLEGVGHEIGPDLLTYVDRDKSTILRAILIPNSDIAPGYDGIIIQTTDGQTFSGTIANETSSQVVLRNVGGGEQTIKREQIQTIRSMEVSLMPDGLEHSMNIDEMADLLEYLKSLN